MVKLSRRKTILGMGLLAGGSGAAFSSASFSQSTESGADFRVVADQQLVVRANAGTNVTNIDEIETTASNPSDYLFGDDTTILGDVSFGDVQDGGEAAVDDGTNGDLKVAVAVTSEEDGKFDPILEVHNQGDTDADVGITISTYGIDVTDGPITEAEVDNSFEFQIDGTNAESSDNNFVEVPAGDVKDISIHLNLGEIDDTNLANAAEPGDPEGGDVFGGGAAVDTVSLVDEIEVGVEDTS